MSRREVLSDEQLRAASILARKRKTPPSHLDRGSPRVLRRWMRSSLFLAEIEAQAKSMERGERFAAIQAVLAG